MTFDRNCDLILRSIANDALEDGTRHPHAPSPLQDEVEAGRDLMVAFGQFLEVLISGLLAGVLYSLVALGFVLIFKASGVFNFAQGSMVLLAGLALVRSLDLLVAKGFPVWAAIVARPAVRRRHHGGHRLAGGALSCSGRWSTRTA